MSETEDVFQVDLPKPGSQMPEEFKDRPYIRVYLASALTGRDEEKCFDDEVRRAICEVLSKSSIRGEAYVIKYEVYNPAEHTSPGSPHCCEEVYHLDFKELVSSDLALFYVNAGSLGMGIERQISSIGGIPAGCICTKKEEVSRMFQGVFGGSLFNINFDVVEELKLKLSDEVAKFGPEILDKAHRRRKAIQEMQANEIPKMIFKRRIVLNMSNENLARETGIQPFWWEKVQRDASGLLAAATFTPILFFRNAVTLQAGWEISEIGIPSLRADNKLGQTEKVSLDNLYEAYVCREDLVDDEVLLSLWEEYHHQDGQNGDTLWENGKVVSKEEWLVRIKEIETTIHERCEKNRIIRLLHSI